MYIFYFIFLILPRSLSCFRIFLDTLPHMVTNGNVLVTSTATTNTLPSTTAITSRPTFSPPEPTKPPVPKYKRGKVKFISYELFPPSVNLTSFQMSNEQEKFMRYESSPQKKLIDRSSPSWNLATRKLLCSPKATRLYNSTVAV